MCQTDGREGTGNLATIRLQLQEISQTNEIEGEGSNIGRPSRSRIKEVRCEGRYPFMV